MRAIQHDLDSVGPAESIINDARLVYPEIESDRSKILQRTTQPKSVITAAVNSFSDTVSSSHYCSAR